ncbi:MAG TPA: ATP-binding protein, partial [Spirochaetia bacterium]|nr:ATP-binding protein [Spirochaetia bacterium]
MVAFSGGSDSTALLLAVATVAPALDITVRAAWVDHGIRPASERAR